MGVREGSLSSQNCRWNGVIRNMDGGVIDLDVSYINLTGQISNGIQYPPTCVTTLHITPRIKNLHITCVREFY